MRGEQSTTTPASSFESLLNQHLLQIEKFKEHIELVKNMISDDKMHVFFDHLLEEEKEHQEETQVLIDSLKRLGSLPSFSSGESSANASSPSVPDRSTGHYGLRDQNVLTVGSMLGVRQ
ncbi:MAG: hypothetical protein K2X66_18500 [Cyanobacteria bacterium]|nr:hypothetical protein [Cyanobacteriota bacterium]